MAPKALNKSRLRQTLDHENRKAQLSERVREFMTLQGFLQAKFCKHQDLT